MLSRIRSWILSCMFVGVAFAQQLTIYTEINAPLEYLGPDGKLTGFAVEVVQEIQKRVGNSDPILVVPWARGYQEVQSIPNAALFSTARTAERETLFKWVGPFMETNFSLYVRADSVTVLKSLEEARKLKAIGVYRDDARDIFLTKAGFTNLERTVDNVANVKKLMTGRINALAAASVNLADIVKSAGYRKEDLREALIFRKSQYYIAFSKGTSDTIVGAWSDAFDSMKQDKTLERIYHSYYPGLPLPGPAAPAP